MPNEEFFEDEFIITLTIDGTEYEEVEVKVTAPYKTISDSAYQLIVFKNKFEYFRSENYNQPRGAWVW